MVNRPTQISEPQNPATTALSAPVDGHGVPARLPRIGHDVFTVGAKGIVQGSIWQVAGDYAPIITVSPATRLHDPPRPRSCRRAGRPHPRDSRRPPKSVITQPPEPKLVSSIPSGSSRNKTKSLAPLAEMLYSARQIILPSL